MPSFFLHQGFAGQQIRCNPWQPNQYIISSSQHFGVVGSGKVYIVEAPQGFAPGSLVRLVGCWGTSDGVFDSCFSEMDQNLVVCACGDGVKVFNVPQSANRDGVMPLIHNLEHQQEVSCVAWHSAKRDNFFSGSWDTTIKLYSAVNPQQSICTFVGHMKEVYEIATTARSPTSFLSCSGDASWKLWDTRTPQRPVLSQFGHQNQIVLSVDFNKVDPNVFATGGVDRTVRVWDARRPNQPLVSLPGHDQACRRVRFSPHSKTLLASGGYDMRVCVWDLNSPQRPMVARYQHHREFVLGVEWSAAVPNMLATTSFDGTCYFIPVGQQPTPSPPQQLPPAVPPPRKVVPRTKVLPGLPQPMPPLPMPGTAPRSPR
ncbi:peroxin-7 [Angomonas deanei]|uniref:Peroxin-7 n=1 Tax=Angomonas deanei TaxID=59799 RepID=S9VBF4_9TRYP|nr:peroxin-7 [Angomonas deanei]EPY38329.1 peroxin-7 [Angomonas deanei]CAD2213369.1 WD domain, G-beta repeat, putative [Angomonas deanei]|eukprot:EPY31134.1 peroxin-7 [Angomonas deanei]